MRSVAWFQVVIGVAVAGMWAVLLATGQVPEVAEGRVDISRFPHFAERLRPI